jgi:hypothetical protein
LFSGMYRLMSLIITRGCTVSKTTVGTDASTGFVAGVGSSGLHAKKTVTNIREDTDSIFFIYDFLIRITSPFLYQKL